MRIGAYVDGFNLYYGGRDLCGRSAPGWRWLDLAAMFTSLIDPALWPGASLTQIVYCTAPRDRAGDPTSLADQLTYVEALRRGPVATTISYGQYVPRVKSGDLVNSRNRRIPSPGPSQIPAWLPVREVPGPSGTGVLRASVTTFEEKGSDVNVASHLLLDVLDGQIDAAIVVSNDSDLGFPIIQARLRIPVGTVNPGVKPTAKALQGQPTDGVGDHWWRRLRPADLTQHQLPNPVAGQAMPAGW